MRLILAQMFGETNVFSRGPIVKFRETFLGCVCLKGNVLTEIFTAAKFRKE